MPKPSLVSNYIYNLSYQILILITPLITAPYVSRVLGSEGIGKYSYAQSIVTYFILFGTVGTNIYGQREIAYAQSDLQKRSNKFFEIIILRFITLSLSILLYISIFINKSQDVIIYKILLIEIISCIFDITWFFQGLEEFKKIVLRNTAIKFVSIVLIFLLVKNADDLPMYTLCSTLPILLGNISLWVYLPKYLLRPNKIKLNNHILSIISLFIPQIATEVYTVLDKIMLGSMSSNIAEVGFYTQSQRLIKMSLCVVTSLGTIMLSRMSHAFFEKNHEVIKNSIYNSFKFVFFIGSPIMIGIAGISINFVPWFFGDGFEKVSILMIITSPIILLIGMSNVIGRQYLLPTNQDKKFTKSVIVGASVNVVLNFIMIPSIGSVGAVISTLISETCVTVTQIIFIRKELKISEVLKQTNSYIIISLIMGIVVYLLGNALPPSIITTMVQIIVGIIIYTLGLIVTKDEILRLFKDILLKKYNDKKCIKELDINEKKVN